MFPFSLIGAYYKKNMKSNSPAFLKNINTLLYFKRGLVELMLRDSCDLMIGLEGGGESSSFFHTGWKNSIGIIFSWVGSSPSPITLEIDFL